MIVMDCEVVPSPHFPQGAWALKSNVKETPENISKEYEARSKNKPHLAQVVSVAWSVWTMDDGPGEAHSITTTDETEIFSRLAEEWLPLMDAEHTVVGWNIRHYDLKFLAHGAMRARQDSLSRRLWPKNSKPWDTNFADLSEAYPHMTPAREAYVSMGIRHASIDAGRLVHDWFKTSQMGRIDSHCRDDVAACNLLTYALVSAGMVQIRR